MIQLKKINKDILNLFLLMLMLTTIFNIGTIVLHNSAKNGTNLQSTTSNRVSSGKTLQNLETNQIFSSKSKGSPSNQNLSSINSTVKTPTSLSGTKTLSTNVNLGLTDKTGSFTTNSVNSINTLQAITLPITING